MSSIYQQHNAIRNRIYIAGRTFERDPVPITLTPRRYESKIRTSNLGLRVDRPFIFAGFPNVPMSYEAMLPYPNVGDSPLLEFLGLITSMGQPFDFAVWKQHYDVFDADGANKTFYLQMRQAVAFNLPAGTPATVFPDYATRIDVYSTPLGSVPEPTPTPLSVVHKDSTNINTGNPASGEAWVEDDGHMVGNRWVSTVRLGDAPAAGQDLIVASYIPLPKMIVDAESPRTYPTKLVETRAVKLVQFG
jgi:hypothetical protein